MNPRLLSATEKQYLKKLTQNYEMSVATAHVAKFRFKESFEQLYKRMVKEEKMVRELQEMFYDVKGKDINHLFKKPNNQVMALNFIRNTYGVNLDKPINRLFINNCYKVYNFLKGVKE